MRKIYHLEVPNRIKKSNPDFRTSTAISTGSDDYFFLRYPHFGHTPSSLSATPHSGQRSMSCLGTNSTKAVHSSKTANEKKRTRRHWHSHKNTTFAWCHALRRPAPVREKKRPKSDSEPALYIFRENRVLKKSVKKRFTASLQPGFCDIKQLYSKKINILRCFTASKRVHLYITDTSLQWISQHSTLGQIRCRHHLKLVHRLRPRISRQPSRWPTSPTQTRAADSRQHRDLDNYTASCCPAIPKANIIASGRTNFAQKCYLCSGKNLKHNERYHSHRFHLRRTEKQVYG